MYFMYPLYVDSCRRCKEMFYKKKVMQKHVMPYGNVAGHETCPQPRNSKELYFESIQAIVTPRQKAYILHASYILKASRLQLPYVNMHTFCILAIHVC
jgi:hypothetical protein